MLTEEEKKFVEYWEQNRFKKKKIFRQLSVGLPLGVLLSVGILMNFLSGWYKRAEMQIRVDASGVLVVLVAILLIVVFVVVFSARHRWDMNENRYKELLSKKNNS
jgi:membrane protein YdbS with pleckstrin-like domain